MSYMDRDDYYENQDYYDKLAWPEDDGMDADVDDFWDDYMEEDE